MRLSFRSNPSAKVCLCIHYVQTNLFTIKGYTMAGFSGQFLRFIEIMIHCFDVALCDIVHDVDAIHSLW